MTPRRRADLSRQQGTLTNEEYRKLICRDMLEKTLQSHVARSCEILGLGYYHTYDSRRSPKGFPDCVIWGPGGVIFRELKRQMMKPTDVQAACIETMQAAGQDVDVWRPSDWFDGRIYLELCQVLDGHRGAFSPYHMRALLSERRVILDGGDPLGGLPEDRRGIRPPLLSDIDWARLRGRPIDDVPLPDVIKDDPPPHD